MTRADTLFRLRALPHSRAVIVFAPAFPERMATPLETVLAPADARRLAAELVAAADEAEAFAATIADPRTNIALLALREQRAYIARRIEALEDAEKIIASRIGSGSPDVL